MFTRAAAKHAEAAARPRLGPVLAALQGWLALVIACGPITLTIPLTKQPLLREGGRLAPRLYLQMPRNGRDVEAMFSSLQKLAFYRWDLRITLFFAPVVPLALFRLQPTRIMSPILLLAGSGAILWTLLRLRFAN